MYVNIYILILTSGKAELGALLIVRVFPFVRFSVRVFPFAPPPGCARVCVCVRVCVCPRSLFSFPLGRQSFFSLPLSPLRRVRFFSVHFLRPVRFFPFAPPPLMSNFLLGRQTRIYQLLLHRYNDIDISRVADSDSLL